ncbi:hypothetical protein BCR34DRAFT_362648 [Clohesyomyces aquaticus]|uniref:Uncharacterized protein n=1 Tax=Clohesyomyces aquaticus TaxID=1231657 RepID=A0A1Y1ZI09_9PLEO|nr:hypothetical protein BCR34DRAFT_362648 [Clohesyomyces aquaticus]
MHAHTTCQMTVVRDCRNDPSSCFHLVSSFHSLPVWVPPSTPHFLLVPHSELQHSSILNPPLLNFSTSAISVLFVKSQLSFPFGQVSLVQFPFPFHLAFSTSHPKHSAPHDRPPLKISTILHAFLFIQSQSQFHTCRLSPPKVSSLALPDFLSYSTRGSPSIRSVTSQDLNHSSCLSAYSISISICNRRPSPPNVSFLPDPTSGVISPADPAPPNQPPIRISTTTYPIRTKTRLCQLVDLQNYLPYFRHPPVPDSGVIPLKDPTPPDRSSIWNPSTTYLIRTKSGPDYLLHLLKRLIYLPPRCSVKYSRYIHPRTTVPHPAQYHHNLHPPSPNQHLEPFPRPQKPRLRPREHELVRGKYVFLGPPPIRSIHRFRELHSIHTLEGQKEHGNSFYDLNYVYYGRENWNRFVGSMYTCRPTGHSISWMLRTPHKRTASSTVPWQAFQLSRIIMNRFQATVK